MWGGTSTPTALFALQGASGSTKQLFDIASSSGTSYLHVTAGGNVGIGTSTPIANFALQGTSGSTSQLLDIASSSGASYLHVTAAGNVRWHFHSNSFVCPAGRFRFVRTIV